MTGEPFVTFIFLGLGNKTGPGKKVEGPGVHLLWAGIDLSKATHVRLPHSLKILLGRVQGTVLQGI